PLLLVVFLLLIHAPGVSRPLPSFPTRRSSDLPFHDASTFSSVCGFTRRSRTSSIRALSSSSRSASCSSVSANAAATSLASCHVRSEEHTSELQSRENLVCRLLLEKKKENKSLH